MLLSKEVEISVLNNNKTYLLGKGYDVSSKKITINVNDLKPESRCLVLVGCDICNKEVNVKYHLYRKSISICGFYSCNNKECILEKKKLTNLKKFGHEWASQSVDIKEKVKSTNLERWGVDCTLQSKEIKEKIKKTNLERWGEDHPMKSDILKEKIKEINLEKWGVEHILKLEHVKEKIKKTNLERWGVDNPLKNEDIYKKSQKTKLERYGDENYNNRDKFLLTNLEKWGMFYTQTSEYRRKSKSTNLERWGVEYPSQSIIIKEKVKLSKLERWGDENYNNITKIGTTNLERYGYSCALKNKLVRDKIENTNLDKYGVKNFIELESVFKKRIESYNKKNKDYIINKYSNLISSDYNIINYVSRELIIKHGDHQFISSVGLLYDRLRQSENCEICTICNPLNSNTSSHENEISNWLESIGLEIERGNRNILNGQELDIFIPSAKIAIEFNGLYWHSERFKDKWYHLNKTKMCENSQIELIHVWEDDWLYKKDIVKSIIKNKLNIANNKIWARKCEVREIDINQCRNFLDNNHIQGYSRCSHKIGLFYNSELVSVMTFGWRKINSKSEFELIRFCSRKDYNVIGGASKLFYNFIKNNKITNSIISYSDISIFSGNLYTKLGFEYKHTSSPNYYWVVNGTKQHRFKYNKKKLVSKFGADIDKSESMIMNEMGYYKVWSCGQIRYEFNI
jgi:hypothetical protein